MHLPRPARSAAFCLATLAMVGAPALGDEWSARKCDLYRAAFADALALQGSVGLRPEFLAQNRAFIAAGCVDRGRVCAKTPEEIALADLLTVMTMNEGMASTFVPFGCAQDP